MVNATIETPAIYGSMLEVMKGVAKIPKNGVMSFGNTSYTYLKADDVQEKLNPLLAENNILVHSWYTTRDVEKGNRQWVYVDLSMRYYSTLDGSCFPPLGEDPIRATGESIAGDDKSINKSLTQSIKNAHRATFQFASGEPEPDDVKTAPASTGQAASNSTQRTVEKARNAGTSADQKKIVAYIGKDEEKRAKVNELHKKFKESGLTADKVNEKIVAELGL